MNATLNGRHIPQGTPQFYHQISKEVARLDAVFNEANPTIAVDPAKQRKPQTARSRYIDTLEIHIQELSIQYLQTRQIITDEFIPIHDGLLIKKNKLITVKLLKELSEFVFAETGFTFNFRIKLLKAKPSSKFYLK